MVTPDELAGLNDADLPVYTILVPLYKESNVAGSIMKAIEALDYPKNKLDVKFLLEADDMETLKAIREHSIPQYGEIIVAPGAGPKTKPRACNHGLQRAKGDYLVIYDAEDRPEPDQLKKSVAAFSKEGEKVVTHGNFKIDSALQILAKPSMMNPGGYYSEGENSMAQSLSTSIESAALLTPALPFYLEVSKALAQDDVHKAGQNLEQFRSQITKIIEMNSLKGKEQGIALEINLLAQKLETIKHDLDSLRKQFSGVSETLREVLKKYEYKEDLKLYLSFCPMALGKGAYWVSDSDQIKNPYFGSKMLDCGEVKEEYGRKIIESKPMEGHAGHKM